MVLAALVLLALLVIVAVAVTVNSAASRDGYLVAPYLDLSSPGERGTHYAMSKDGFRGHRGYWRAYPWWRRFQWGRQLPAWWWPARKNPAAWGYAPPLSTSLPLYNYAMYTGSGLPRPSRFPFNA